MGGSPSFASRLRSPRDGGRSLELWLSKHADWVLYPFHSTEPSPSLEAHRDIFLAAAMAAERVVLPDLLRDWPTKRYLDPRYPQVREASRQWFKSFDFLNAKSTKAFDRCDFAKLAMLSYRFSDLAQCQLGSDLMTLLYAFDEYTDWEDEHSTRGIADLFMDGLRNPDKPRPEGECVLGEMARQFWSAGRKIATPMAERHFIETMQQWVDNVVDEARDHDHSQIRTIDEYWTIRRHTSACLPTLASLELEFDFPEDVYRHPLLERLRDLSMFSIVGGNDLYSYNVERAKGHELHNLLTLVMHEKNLNLQSAVDWIGEWHDEIVAEFMECKANLPSWGVEIDTQVRRYVDGMMFWVRGADDWSFEGPRYFGSKGLEVQKTRVVYMLPKLDASALGNKGETVAPAAALGGFRMQM
ncbi:terpenoid synthase [Apodospora peruviana]|uniref:Terpene synthase n=1 Tax=Apodospora peruviana TaxID=516989 RepID=A0AAE0MGU1_9PEZI|nr:terpenoid synthase [Apodospora peruviana]